MPKLVALFRGINVGGRGMIPMADLKAFLEEQGCSEVRTLLQSGNALFTARATDLKKLEQTLEKKATARWPLPLSLFVSDAAEWSQLVAGNPYTAEAAKSPGYLLAMVLKDKPAPAAITALRAGLTGPEYFHAEDRVLYIFYPTGSGNSRFSYSYIEKKLGTRGTCRNWNTVLKISALLNEA